MLLHYLHKGSGTIARLGSRSFMRQHCKKWKRKGAHQTYEFFQANMRGHGLFWKTRATNVQLSSIQNSKNKPPRVLLSFEDESFNRKVSSDHTIVENCFGKTCSIFAVTIGRFRWAKKNYNTLFCLCAALTNSQVCWQLLQNTDLEARKRDCGHVYSISE